MSIAQAGLVNLQVLESTVQLLAQSFEVLLPHRSLPMSLSRFRLFSSFWA